MDLRRGVDRAGHSRHAPEPDLHCGRWYSLGAFLTDLSCEPADPWPVVLPAKGLIKPYPCYVG